MPAVAAGTGVLEEVMVTVTVIQASPGFVVMAGSLADVGVREVGTGRPEVDEDKECDFVGVGSAGEELEGPGAAAGVSATLRLVRMVWKNWYGSR